MCMYQYGQDVLGPRRDYSLNINRDFFLDVYTILNQIKYTIWTLCAFRVLEKMEKIGHYAKNGRGKDIPVFKKFLLGHWD